jgi:hypothetical protein
MRFTLGHLLATGRADTSHGTGFVIIADDEFGFPWHSPRVPRHRELRSVERHTISPAVPFNESFSASKMIALL